ncbi:hypothetical protein C7S18_20315 [Ahniella affigens]|uniref:Type IV pilus biogenesis protein PilP n=2 Tax=Ahniella affigens TaxID=2021234 RepID=A0A2P1PX07_9GAMM|nr:hypothetical protein C7S18_20315 [Ahniella affigens]
MVSLIALLLSNQCVAQTTVAPAPDSNKTIVSQAPQVTAAPNQSPPQVVRPDATLQQQIQLQQLNAQVSKELERLNNEVQIETVRQTLQEKREGSMPEFLGTFRSPAGSYAEFRVGQSVQERKVGELVTAEWRVEEVHSDRVRLCKVSHAQCRTLTPATNDKPVSK